MSAFTKKLAQATASHAGTLEGPWDGPVLLFHPQPQPMVVGQAS